MRPLRNYAEVGGGNLMEKRSLGLEHAEESWDQWEIHCLILVSLSLQVFLSSTADLRRRSASRVLRTVLWLAYMSADTVAVFAQGPSHELVLFWAPFVLVHLGGQDTITAFSKQDNELWTRHLLGLVTQTAVAGYVVSKSSWPDARLRAAMVLIFLCGFLKYAGRTYCLYSASPKSLRAQSMASLSNTLRYLQRQQKEYRAGRPSWRDQESDAKARYKEMFLAGSCWKMEFIASMDLNAILGPVDDTMLVDAPIDDWQITTAADELPDLLKEYKKRPDRCIAYECVAASLGKSYRLLYTKAPLPRFREYAFDIVSEFGLGCGLTFLSLVGNYTLFQCTSTTIALVLFAYAQKEGHHSKADITVSYILLVGATVLDLQPALTSVIISYARKAFPARTASECAELCLLVHPLDYRHTRKHWSEELAQYSMTRRYASVQGHYACLPSFWDWIVKRKPFELTRTPVTDDLKLFVLDRLLLLQTRRQDWDFASFRGERALGKWMDSHQVPEPERSSYALYKSISSRVEFAARVLIWHIATDICYFSVDNAYGVDTEPDEIKKRKKMSRELSHYIMYLVFKCDVMLTSNSRLAHEKTHEQLRKYFRQVRLDEKKTVIRMFEVMKEEANKKEKQQQGSMQGVAQDKKNEEIANEDAAATTSGSGTQELLQRAVEAVYSPLLPLVREVVQGLNDIVHDEAHRWELISEVWLEMLFYTAPRCGAAFHCEHLSTGGEFITHVLFLMRSLGPFMPKPKSGA